MIGILRHFARAFSSYRRGLVGVNQQPRRDGATRVPPDVPAQTVFPNRQAAIIDRARARRVRCLSEPCANTRLAIALLRAERRGQAPAQDFGMMR